MGKTHVQPDYPRGLTFEDVWAALMETRERQEKDAREWREQHEKNAREWKEQHEKDAREWREQHKETDRIVKEAARIVGGLGNSFGEVIESMVEPNLLAKFKELGLDFDKIHHGTKIKDKNDKTIVEVDFSLENYDKVMLVEVKARPVIADIKYHITRIQKMRAHADLHGGRQVFLGAVAGIVIRDNVRKFALKNGLYIVQPSGETFIITVPEGIYSPQEW